MAVITISREMGTGAYQIARELAKRLKYTLVDGPKIAELSAAYGLTDVLLQRVDEKPPAYITAEDRLHAAHLKTVELILIECARKGNVILYGRGGQDLLEGLRNVLRLRFIGTFDERVENFAEREWIDPDLARELIRKSDHQRGGFIHFYFDRDWNDPLGYDMVFNTSRLSEACIVEAIIAAARDPKVREAEQEAAGILDEILLCKKIEMEILRSPKVENLHFKITSMDAVVSLTGHVHSEQEKQAALQIASAVSGVLSVNDRLQVVGYKSYKE
jgi:cytidylate kinase